MPLSDMFTDGVVPFIRKNLDSGAFRSDHWTFIHIPKTAGSSFREEIANVKQPDYNIEVDYQAINPARLDDDYSRLLHEATERYATQFFERTRFVSGHVPYNLLAQFPKFEGSKLIAMLREPSARLASDFLHRTSVEHGNWEAACGRYSNFMSFIEDPNNQNTMWQYLCRDFDEPVEETIRFVCERFTWVGLQEMYPLSLKVLFALFGMRVEPMIVLRRSTSNRRDEVVLTPSEHQRMVDLNGKDNALFAFFHARCSEAEQSFYKVSDYDNIFRLLNDLPVRSLAETASSLGAHEDS